MGYKVLLAQDVHDSGKKLLRDNGFEIVLSPIEDENTVKELIQDCDAVFSKTFFLNEEILRSGEKLKVIAKHGTGIDNVVDIDTATRLGFFVVNTPLANCVSVAEHTITGMMAFAKKLVKMDAETRKGNFRANECGDLHEVLGKTIGIIGLGNIGRKVAKIAALGLDMKIIGYDPYVKSETLPDYINLLSEIDEIFKQSDFVTLHLGVSAETKGLVDKTKFALMKSTAVFMNFARGPIVIEKDLIDALKNGVIAGAVLDVYESEPVSSDNPLLNMGNVLLSPHSAAVTDEALSRMSYQGAQGIVEVLSGRKPTWCPNFDRIRKI